MGGITKVVIGIIVLVLVIWGISALVTTSPKTAVSPTTSGEPIKIGFIGPLTGDAASLGTVARAAVEVAADEINKANGIGGRNLEVIYEDGQCSPKAASNAGNKLINVDKVTAIVGGLCSSETATFAPVAMQSKTIVMSYCSSAPNLSSTGKYFFRDYPSDAYQGKFAAEYVYNTLGARNVALLFHISDWGTGIKDVFKSTFESLGGKIVAEEGTKSEARDYKTQLTKIKAAKPDYIYMPSYPEGATVAVKQARELGINTKMLGADAWSDLKFQKDVSGKGDILYIESATSMPDDFKAKILAKTGGDQVPLCAPQAYDATKILAQVMSKVGTDPDKIQDELRAIQYSGVSGSIDFDENGDVTVAKYVVKRIADGTATEVK